MSPPGSSARHSPAASGASAERWLQKAFGEASVNVVDRASARREEVRWTSRARARGSRATRDFETVFKRSNSEDSGGRARRREVGDARG